MSWSIEQHGPIVASIDHGDWADVTYQDGTKGSVATPNCRECGERIAPTETGLWRGPGLGVIHMTCRAES